MTPTTNSLRRKPRVYVVHHTNPKHNIVSALEFGDCIAVLDRNDEPDPLNAQAVTNKIKNRLQHFAPQDYLLLVGSPIAIAIASAVAAELTDGQLQLLKWDQAAGRYFMVAVNTIFREEGPYADE